MAITPENLKISDRASLLLPWHRDLDALEEARLADKKYGSTKQGIAPFYSDKYQKKTVMAGELLYPDKLWDHLAGILEWKNLTLEQVYGAKPYTMDDLKAWVTDFGEKIKPFICDTGAYLRQAQAEGKHILFEAQLGSLRDLDYGIYPYTTSSNPIAAYAPVGSGLPTAKLDKVIGVVKAYSSCVGEGPFTCEWFGEEAEKLREAGGEYGAKTGRPRRVGPIDIVATRYGIQCQGATDIALTKLDVLSYMDEIPICARYELNGQETDDVPLPRRAAGRQARDDRHARLEVRHLRRPEVGGPAPGGPGLCGVCGAGDRLPYHLCVRGTGKRFHHHSVRRKSDAVCRIRVDRVGRCPLLAVSPLPDHFKSIEGSFRGVSSASCLALFSLDFCLWLLTVFNTLPTS